MKLTDILKEIKIKNKNILGQGYHGEVFNFEKDPTKIIKKPLGNNKFSEDELKFYKEFNQHPNLFPHIYKITPTYVVMDKLNPINWEGLLNFLEIINMWREEDPLNKIWDIVTHNEDPKELNNIIEYCKQNNELKHLQTINKYIKFAEEIYNFFKNKNIDFHSGNIGEDVKGNLKIFDLSLDF